MRVLFRHLTGIVTVLAATTALSNRLPAAETPQAGSPRTTLLRLPPAVQKPVIDGVMKPGEWDDTSWQFGGISKVCGKMSVRWLDFYFGYDDEFLYFAHQSILPPEPMKLPEQDTVELIVQFPDAPVKKIVFNTKGEGDLPEGSQLRSRRSESRFWETELAVPLKSLGIMAIPYGKECKLQMIRHYSNPDDAAEWHPSSKQVPYAVWIPEKEIPLISFQTLWTHRANPTLSHRPTCKIKNRTSHPARIAGAIRVDSVKAPALETKTMLTVKPGAGEIFQMRGIWPRDVDRSILIELGDAETGKIYYQRSFSFNGKVLGSWKDPDPPYLLMIASYPSYKRLRARLTCANVKKREAVREVVFVLRRADGGEVARLTPKTRQDGCVYDGALPDLPEGTYHIVAEFKNAKGETEKLSDHFEIRHFAWEGLNLGKDRIIVPPFKPLQAKDGEVRALQTGFKEAGNGFWDAIYALDENILAKPVEFVIDGQPFETVAVREIETSPDLVIRETDLRYKELKLTVRREYEQDGFCKVTLKFDPEKPFRITSLDLNFPVKKALAKYFYSVLGMARTNLAGVIPDKNGVVLNSCHGTPQHPYFKGFHPYIWLGEYRKGLAYVCDNPHLWGRKTGVASQTVTVDDDAVRLRLHLAAAPRTYKKGDAMVLAFQPTPVKPQPKGWRQYCTRAPYFGEPLSDADLHYSTAPKGAKGLYSPIFLNYIYSRYEDGLCALPDNDWSLFRYFREGKWKTDAEAKRAIGDYIKRHNLNPRVYSMMNGPNFWWTNCPMERYLLMAAQQLKHADYAALYGNPRVISPSWPEFEVYTDEWEFSTWRRRVFNAYSADPVPSYVDFTLYNIRRGLRSGLDGYYYDNIFQVPLTDPVTSEARETSSGAVQPVFGILTLRDLVKRTAVMMHQEKKDFCGYPALMLHMTDCPFVPVLSFAGLQLDWEAKYGEEVYQKRFPEAYGLTSTSGVQAGVCPVVIVNIAGVQGKEEKILRSAIAMSFLYNVIMDPRIGLRFTPFFRNILNKIYEFGYGNEDTTVIPAYAPENPVTAVPDRVKATVVRRADGALLLQIGNLGEAAEAEFDLHGLAKGEATDLMTGKKLGSGGRFKLSIADHDFALVEVRP